MKHSIPLISLALISIAASPLEHHGEESSASPLELGSRLELFVDDYLTDSMQGLELKLHTPEPAGKAMVFDKPWEGVTSGSEAVVFQDGDLYRMYYRGSSHHGYALESLLKPNEVVVPEHPPTACYAESRDGIHWTRPNLGLIEFDGSKENNIVWMGKGSASFMVVKDTNPAAPEQERYKAVGPDRWEGRSGLFAFTSPDGIRWKQMQEEPILTDGAFDSPNLTFWDTVNERYVCVYRDFAGGVRTIRTSFSTDFRNWTEGQWGEFGEAPPEHLYTNATWPYFRAPHIYLAFPRRFLPWKTMKPFDQGSISGCSDAIFMSSRDAVHWTRFLEAFIRPGMGVRNWVHRTNTPAWGLLALEPHEISLFIQRDYTFPSNYMERMVLRTDGFVSLHAGYSGGEWISKPLTFEGDNLVLNFATSAAGSIRLEIQDAEGQALPGFALEESPLVWGDEIEYQVIWTRSHAKATSGEPLRRFAGKPVRLRIVMKDADLFSLRFR